MHIFDKLENLCAIKGVKVPDAYNEMKINKGTISLWKTARDNGQVIIPSTKNAIKLSAYFEKPVGYFLNDNEIETQKNSPSEDRELDKETIELENIWNSANQEERELLLSMARMLKDRRGK